MLEFPDGFLWGAATAAHQIEGNNVNSNWWAMEHQEGTHIVEPSGDAADSYHRFRDDMRLLADLGLNSYRFSIEWARIEPERGFVSRAEVDHYRRMVDTALEFGLEPVVTLMHFTVPRWFDHDGFWRAPDAADLFARYTEIALPIVSSGVRYVCTINEPNIAAMLAGGEDAANLVAFGLPNPDLGVADALLESHRRSREVLSSVAGLKSGWTVATQAFHAPGEPGSAEALRAYGHPRDDWYLENARGDDFVGVQAYTRTFIGPNGPLPVADDVETTLTGREVLPARRRARHPQRMGAVGPRARHGHRERDRDGRRLPPHRLHARRSRRSPPRHRRRHPRARLPALVGARQLRVGERLRPHLRPHRLGSGDVRAHPETERLMVRGGCAGERARRVRRVCRCRCRCGCGCGCGCGRRPAAARPHPQPRPTNGMAVGMSMRFGTLTPRG
jgi:beta-glucosidase